jgi:acetolactate synthase-1/2/3 large subunit
VLAVMGDGAFLMNSQEIETGVREQDPAGGVGLELGEYHYVASVRRRVSA